MAFGSPAQHAAGKIGNIAKACFAQDDGSLCGAAAGSADGDDRAIARQFAGALGQLTQRDQDGAANVSEGADELFGLANVEDLDRRRVLLKPVRIDLPDPGNSALRLSRRRFRAARISDWRALPHRVAWGGQGEGFSCSR